MFALFSRILRCQRSLRIEAWCERIDVPLLRPGFTATKGAELAHCQDSGFKCYLGPGCPTFFVV